MNIQTHPGFRFFILGAGFSKPAGLPIASELYPLVQRHIHSLHGKETKFDRDVEDFLAYSNAAGFSGQTKESLDLERFMSYLDIEHYLGFRGKDTWSIEGNESQLMIRQAIGSVIHNRTPPPDKIPDVYLRFAEALSVHDTVLTLNYDLVLEYALAAVGKPFRRYPNRFKKITKYGGTLDSDTEEVILLKLHGSLDWFDERPYLEIKNTGTKLNNIHSVFDDPARFESRPLVEGLLPEGDKLKHIFWINKPDSYYRSNTGMNCPFILSPSYVKFVYAEPILSLWNGIGRGGAWNLGISIVGFSLPEHDEYIRIALYQMFSNYKSWWDQQFPDKSCKDFVRFVDFRPTEDSQADYKKRYGFADVDKSKFYFEGFDSKAIEFLFNQNRQLK